MYIVRILVEKTFDTNSDAIDMLKTQQAYTIQLTVDSVVQVLIMLRMKQCTLVKYTIGEVTSWKAS